MSKPASQRGIRSTLDRRMKEKGFSARETIGNNDGISGPIPQLKPVAESERPHLLFLDDEAGFLKRAVAQWESNYANAFVLQTLLLAPDNQHGGSTPHDNGNGNNYEGAIARSLDEILAWLTKVLDTCHRPVLFLDRNNPLFKPDDLLPRLKKDERTRYLPVVFMTTADKGIQFQDIDTIIAQGALRILYDKQAAPFFIYQCASMVEQLYYTMEERKWRDLRHSLVENLDHRDYEQALSDFKKRLKSLFGVAYCFFRKQDEQGLLRWCMEPCGAEDQNKIAPQCLDPQSVPLLHRLLNERETLRCDSLGTKDIGKDLPELIGQSALAAPLRYGQAVLGTLSLYRSSDKPFTYADEIHIQPVAQELAVWLGQREEKKRRDELLRFADDMGKANSEIEIIQLLTKRLHQDIHHNDDDNSKLTCRTLTPDSGLLLREIAPLGIQPDDNSTIDIDTEQSIYAECVRLGRPVRCEDVKESPPCKGRFLPTVEGMGACLTAPLLTDSGLCLGAINLEHREKRYYSTDDETHVILACRMAANAMQRLRSNRFKQHLIRIARLRRQPVEEILAQSYQALFDYFRFARLLLLSPGPQRNGPWQVTQVIRPGGRIADQKDIEIWRMHISRHWERTYVRSVLESKDRTGFLPEQSKQYPDDRQMGLRTRSELVVKIEGDNGRTEKLLVILFRLPRATDPQMAPLLEEFADLLNSLYQSKEQMRMAYMQQYYQAADKTAQNMRHTLRGSLGALENKVAAFERKQITADQFLSATKTILQRLSAAWRSYKHLLKTRPEPMEVDLGDCWQRAGELALGDQDMGTTAIQPLPDRPNWRTDGDLLRAIFANLIQNALETEPPASNVWLEWEKEKSELHLLICNDGPPIAKSQLPHLFELGVSNKTSGTGWGLHYSRHIAQQLGGDLYLQESEPGRTCFSLSLPKLMES